MTFYLNLPQHTVAWRDKDFVHSFPVYIFYEKKYRQISFGRIIRQIGSFVYFLKRNTYFKMKIKFTVVYAIFWTILQINQAFGSTTLGSKGIYILNQIQYQVAWRLQFLGYLRILTLKFQRATSKIEVFLSLPYRLSQFSSN